MWQSRFHIRTAYYSNLALQFVWVESKGTQNSADESDKLKGAIITQLTKQFIYT